MYANGNGNGAMHIEPIRRTAWRDSIPDAMKVVQVKNVRMLMECWPYVSERIAIIKKKDKNCGNWQPQHVRHMVQEGFSNPAIRYPVELHLALDESGVIYGFIVGYVKIDPYINLPMTYHIWLGWLNRQGIERFAPWLKQRCWEQGLTGVEFESGRFGWMGTLKKLMAAGFVIKQTVYRMEIPE